MCLAKIITDVCEIYIWADSSRFVLWIKVRLNYRMEIADPLGTKTLKPTSFRL
jgi:hypothetical protein